LMWMLSTKMMPAVGVLVPMYLIFRDTGLLDTRTGLVIVLTLINLPIVVWMLYTYFKEIPAEILEAARMDGASLRSEILYVLTPMAVPGIASTLLLNIILAWNEAFWTLNLTAAKAAPLTAFIASYSSPEGLFYAKLSAASTMAIAPILIMGWFSQKQLVRGVAFGGVKYGTTHGTHHARTGRQAVRRGGGDPAPRPRDRGRGVRGIRRPLGLREVDASPANRRAGGRLGRHDPHR